MQLKYWYKSVINLTASKRDLVHGVTCLIKIVTVKGGHLNVVKVTFHIIRN